MHFDWDRKASRITFAPPLILHLINLSIHHSSFHPFIHQFIHPTPSFGCHNTLAAPSSLHISLHVYFFSSQFFRCCFVGRKIRPDKRRPDKFWQSCQHTFPLLRGKRLAKKKKQNGEAMFSVLQISPLLLVGSRFHYCCELFGLSCALCTGECCVHFPYTWSFSNLHLLETNVFYSHESHTLLSSSLISYIVTFVVQKEDLFARAEHALMESLLGNEKNCRLRWLSSPLPPLLSLSHSDMLVT